MHARQATRCSPRPIGARGLFTRGPRSPSPNAVREIVSGRGTSFGGVGTPFRGTLGCAEFSDLGCGNMADGGRKQHCSYGPTGGLEHPDMRLSTPHSQSEAPRAGGRLGNQRNQKFAAGIFVDVSADPLRLGSSNLKVVSTCSRRNFGLPALARRPSHCWGRPPSPPLADEARPTGTRSGCHSWWWKSELLAVREPPVASRRHLRRVRLASLVV